MAYAVSGDVKLYYEVTGAGTPIVFVHEFGGDYRSWEAQVRYLSRFYQCITFDARGYPPSDVPSDPAAYSQEIFTADIAAVLKHLGIERAHIVGLSMGSFSTLMFGIEFAQMARSITLCGCGYGSIPDQRQAWLDSNSAMAAKFEADFTGTMEAYASRPTRLTFRNKDPRGWNEFLNGLKNLSPEGAILTLKGVQFGRPPVSALQDQLRALDMPALIVVGDEDDPALEPSFYLKRQIRKAGLCVFPKTGHAVNTEEPALFNQALLEFFSAVDNDRWQTRGPGRNV